MTETTRKPGGRTISQDQVDDVIGVAAELAERDARQVALDDVKKVGRELGLSPEHVEEAVGELRRREATETVRRTAEARKRRLALTVGGAAVGLVVLTVGLAALGARSDLQSAYEAVERQEAQVNTVRARQAEVQALFAGRTPTQGADDELVGALNRVAVERKRYDEAAAAYNARVGGFPASLWARLFGFPGEVPPSSQVEGW